MQWRRSKPIEFGFHSRIYIYVYVYLFFLDFTYVFTSEDKFQIHKLLELCLKDTSKKHLNKFWKLQCVNILYTRTGPVISTGCTLNWHVYGATS